MSYLRNAPRYLYQEDISYYHLQTTPTQQTMPKQTNPSNTQELNKVIKATSPFTKLGKQLDSKYKFKPVTLKQQVKQINKASFDLNQLKDTLEEQLHPLVKTIQEDMADLKETIYDLQTKFEQTAPFHFMHPEDRDMRKCTVNAKECFAMFKPQNAKCDGCIRLFDCTVVVNETTRLHIMYKYFECYDNTWTDLYLCSDCCEKFLDFKFDPEYLRRRQRYSTGYLRYDKYIDARNQTLALDSDLDLLGCDLETFLLNDESGDDDDRTTVCSDDTTQPENARSDSQYEVFRILNAATADVLAGSFYHQSPQL